MRLRVLSFILAYGSVYSLDSCLPLAQAAAVAPSCKFTALEPNAEAGVLKALAELRAQLGEARSAHNAALSAVLARHYQQKLVEARGLGIDLSKLPGLLTGTGGKQTRDRDEQKRRESKVEAAELQLKPPMYDFAREVPLPPMADHPSLVGTLFDKTILIRSDRSIGALDVETGASHFIDSSYVDPVISHDGRRVIYFDQNWNLHVYDVHAQKDTHKVRAKIHQHLKRGDNQDFNKIDLSPNEKLVVLGGCLGTVVIFDVETGEVVAKTKNDQSWIKNVQFVSDDRVVFNGERYLYALDIDSDTPSQTHLGLGKSAVFGLSISWDHQVATVAAYGEMRTFSTETLEQISTAPVYGLAVGKGAQTIRMIQVPNDAGHVLMIGTQDASNYGIYYQHYLDLLRFDFERRYSAPNSTASERPTILNAVFARDKSQVSVLIKKDDKFFFDVWSLKP